MGSSVMKEEFLRSDGTITVGFMAASLGHGDIQVICRQYRYLPILYVSIL